MPRGLQRFQQSRQSHFVTFSCYRRQPNFSGPETYDLFVQCLEDMRRRFSMCIYGYVVMPEHVHLLVNEPRPVSLAETIYYLKLSLYYALHGSPEPFPEGAFLIPTENNVIVITDRAYA
ncbi:MAG: transposase [Terriglobales bacterium]